MWKNRDEFCGDLAKHYDASQLILVEIPYTGKHWMWSEGYCLKMIQQCEIEIVAARMMYGTQPEMVPVTMANTSTPWFTLNSHYIEHANYARAKLRWEAHLSRVRHHTRER